MIDTLNQAKTQLVNSREAKHRLEMDWSDKVIPFMLHSYFNIQDLFCNLTLNDRCYKGYEILKFSLDVHLVCKYLQDSILHSS